ncbi:MAG: hypothetical protein IJ685_06685 [Selenomonadaceae bacterium]|nr:hypothetical protein [Selenomonadaceae bacterium]
MMVYKWIDVGAPLTPEQEAELDELSKMTDDDIVFDEDCPPQTPEQLKKFKRVNPRPKKQAAS